MSTSWLQGCNTRSFDHLASAQLAPLSFSSFYLTGMHFRSRSLEPLLTLHRLGIIFLCEFTHSRHTEQATLVLLNWLLLNGIYEWSEPQVSKSDQTMD